MSVALNITQIAFWTDQSSAADYAGSTYWAIYSNVSGSPGAVLFSGIRIAGRLRNDIRSTLRGEMNVQTGVGFQSSSAQRWGDYSTMQIDPDDDCTFWFTTEYTNTSSQSNWATRIVSFRFNSCQ